MIREHEEFGLFLDETNKHSLEKEELSFCSLQGGMEMEDKLILYVCVHLQKTWSGKHRRIGFPFEYLMSLPCMMD